MKIAVDPGHGMSNATDGVFDSGATATDANGKEVQEADIALDYGLLLVQKLRDRGIDVFLTRENNTDPDPFRTRAARAVAEGCDHFVSFHLNDSESSSAHGLEVLYRSDSKDKPLAQSLQSALVSVTGFRDRGVQQRTDVAVLKFGAGPAVLIELGFIGNDSDRGELLKPETRDAVCDAVVGTLVAGLPAPKAAALKPEAILNVPVHAPKEIPIFKGKVLSEMNVYNGLVDDSFRFFADSGVVMYESRLTIDGDGSGGEGGGGELF